ncbi:MAG TPA: ACP S-malonyltransferase, partial [Kineosporiaceae bacterium]|nr:ACP S-malonyltransferase [Kineosporiaceae bacterium]
HRTDERRSHAGVDVPQASTAAAPAAGAAAGTVASVPAAPVASSSKAPLRGALVVGAASDSDLARRLADVVESAASVAAKPPAAPAAADLRAPVRVTIDYGDAAELADRAGRALKAVQSGQPAAWKMLRSRGVFFGRGPAPKTAFLYTGQGSQYVNMLKALCAVEPIVADTFAEADRVMTPLLGRPLTDYIFIDAQDPAAVAQLEQQLLQTEITQPAVLATDAALTRLLDAYGIGPDMVMGHSLGEYGALVAAQSLTFPAALEAVSARGREMASLSMGDNGAMAAVLAPLPEIERIVEAADGYVVIANVNSNGQAVIGGATPAVEKVVAELKAAGQTAIRLPVSHAFHTSIVAPASEPLKVVLRRLNVVPPRLPMATPPSICTVAASTSSPAPPAASSMRSRPTWPLTAAEASSTCST